MLKYPVSSWEPTLGVVVLGVLTRIVVGNWWAGAAAAALGLLLFLGRYLDAEREAYHRLEERLTRLENGGRQ